MCVCVVWVCGVGVWCEDVVGTRVWWDEVVWCEGVVGCGVVRL